jgi:hypothetical protein
MSTRLTTRLASFGLSVAITLVMLGSVNFLATVEPATTALLAVAAPVLA